ncbi:hypothetical protein FA13DRAFT_1740515 [Coprinellus micaceus]|uniref:WD40 repeat-like protein n=1 Tax=Coprinellus micaceus TaxID=71717 RepID=A0A4Y7SLX8_COPMI|nr:hypothetical protein FA13DRAFT_1740515 [Coprinellus micaceus]
MTNLRSESAFRPVDLAALCIERNNQPTKKNGGQWDADIFNGHAIGCNAVSWAPAVVPGSIIDPQQPSSAAHGQPLQPRVVKRFASAGCDNLVKVWGYREDPQPASRRRLRKATPQPAWRRRLRKATPQL